MKLKRLIATLLRCVPQAQTDLHAKSSASGEDIPVSGGGRWRPGDVSEADLEAPLLPPADRVRQLDSSDEADSGGVAGESGGEGGSLQGAEAAAGQWGDHLEGEHSEGDALPSPRAGIRGARPAPLDQPSDVGLASRPHRHHPAASALRGGASSGASLFRPLHPSAWTSWTWLDWARFLVVKHSLDALLVRIRDLGWTSCNFNIGASCHNV